MDYGFVSATSPGEPTGSLDVWRPKYGGDGIAPQPDGYHALDSRYYASPLLRYDATGRLLSSDGTLNAVQIEGVPGGGSVLLTSDPSLVYRVVFVDADGRKVASSIIPQVAGAQAAVSSEGNVLVFSDFKARWFDRAGSPMTDWFSYDLSVSWLDRQDPVALADGSIVVALGTDHALRFAAGENVATAPPGWVTSRAGATIAVVRGGKANAFATVRTGGTAGCTVDVEILTAAGESCGTTHLESPPPCDRVTFGADRTLFTTGELPTGASGSCAWHWWSGLLR
jgi:hypothetical protein